MRQVAAQPHPGARRTLVQLLGERRGAAVGGEAVVTHHLRPPARQARQHAGAGIDEHVGPLVRHQAPDEQDQPLPHFSDAGRHVDAVGQHRHLAHCHALKEAAAQVVGHGDHPCHPPEQRRALRGGGGAAHALGVVVQEQDDTREAAGQIERDLRPIMHFHQVRPELAQGGGGTTGITHRAAEADAGPHRLEPHVRERVRDPAPHHGAAGSAGQPVHQQADGPDGAGRKPLARRQDGRNPQVNNNAAPPASSGSTITPSARSR